jgi:hypothetical protein
VPRVNKILTEELVLVTHSSLDWGGSFPGSHNFYRIRDHPDGVVYLAKPKPKSLDLNENRKRLQREETKLQATKRACIDLRGEAKPTDADEDSGSRAFPQPS